MGTNGTQCAPNIELWKLRRNAGLSTKELGDRVGCSAKTIRACERGHIPREWVQRRIAAYFGMDATELFDDPRVPVPA
jgi:DNA-binding XRE family transcriptional regulator